MVCGRGGKRCEMRCGVRWGCDVGGGVRRGVVVWCGRVGWDEVWGECGVG